MNHGESLGIKLGLTRAQAARLASLRTPEKIQEYISAIPINFEPDGDTCLSVQQVLKQKRAHCIEASFVAACALWMAGDPPLIMDMQAHKDYDHVIAVFKRGKCWGAISKTNHIWMRWRDPIYRSLRELAMSYFHEYVQGPRKTLSTYSRPVDLRRVDPALWVTNRDDCWDMVDVLNNARHYPLIDARQRRALYPRDRVELKGDKILQFKAPDRQAENRY